MQLNTVQWISLPIQIRVRLVEIFDIPRSGNTEVENNQVVTDGYTHKDLAKITEEKMQGFLLDTTEGDYFKLFHRVLDVLHEQLRKEEQEAIDQAIIINTKEEIKNETKEDKQIEGPAQTGITPKTGSDKDESKGKKRLPTVSKGK